MIYLASPYSHRDECVREARFLLVCKVAALWMSQGIHVFSPIAHTHPIALAGNLHLGWDFWKFYDGWFIEKCSEVRVLMIDGWDESVGIAEEIKMAKDLDKIVTYWKFDGLNLKEV